MEFASAGPKNYDYEQDNGKRECKVKGFSLNVEGSQYLNYELLKNNVLEEIQNPQYNPVTGKVVPRQHPIRRSHRIVRDPKTFAIKTVAEEKKYQLVYEKRVIDPNTFKTYPYGYGDIVLEDSQTMKDSVIDPNTFKTYPYGYGDIVLEDSQTMKDINLLLDM